MKHPLLNPARNINYYLSAWLVVVTAHALVMSFYTSAPVLFALVDSLLFNGSFAGFGLVIWYWVRFTRASKDRGRIVLNHLGIASAFLMVWISLGTFILTLFSPDRYDALLKEVIPFRFFGGLLYYLILIFFYYSYSYYLSARENLVKASELKALVKETQLELLKNQMNPHFIFNSLNSVSALTLTDPDKARDMVIALSSFLRYSLSQKPDQLIPFSEELNNGIIYLEIEKTRFGDRLDFSTDIGEGCREAPIPGMILQPALENAVKHGAYESLGPVRIRLEARLKGDLLIITVGNNYETGGNSSGKGLGLKSIREKLFLMYGRAAELKIKDEDHYFEVSLFLPVPKPEPQA